MDWLDGQKLKMASKTGQILRVNSKKTVVHTEDDIQHGVSAHPNNP